MPPRKFKRPLPAASAKQEEEVQALLLVPDLRIPENDEFKGYVLEEDIADLATRDRKTILSLSVIEQWTDWQTQVLIDLWAYVQHVDKEVAITKIANAKLRREQQEQGWKWTLLKWFGVTVGASLLSKLIGK